MDTLFCINLLYLQFRDLYFLFYHFFRGSYRVMTYGLMGYSYGEYWMVMRMDIDQTKPILFEPSNYFS